MLPAPPTTLLTKTLALRGPTAATAPTLWLGAMNFGKRTPKAEALAICARALELGVTAVDTANAYVDGESERIVGEALKRAKDEVVVATKCGFGRVGGKPEGLAPERLRAAADESRKRLGRDVLDLYYLHVPDHETPIDATLDGVSELLQKGVIRAWGVSNYAAWQVLDMMHRADARGMPRPSIAQQLYNVLVRQLDVEWFGFARACGIATVVYNPLAGGLLSGRHAREGAAARPPAGSRFDKNALYQRRYWTGSMFDRTEQLTEVAKKAGMPLLDLAYAWLAQARSVDAILLGPGTVAQLEDGVRATRRALPEGIAADIDALHRTWLGTDTYYVR